MNQHYINTAKSNVDSFIQRENWFFNLKINNYEIVMILWNMALVLVPWLMAMLLRSIWQKTSFQGFKYKLLGVMIFLIWLLFIPNTAYMITEVRHLLDYCPRDAAFQICEEDAWIPLFFFAYGLFGWVSFVCLTDQMRSLLEDMFNRTAGSIFVIVLMPVMALGVLLGLFNRWNSWELFLYPKQVLGTVCVYFTNPIDSIDLIMFTLFFYLFYFGGHWLLKERGR